MSETIELARGTMWALAHPIRFRIWELLREGPSTAARLARRLDESRGTASYHLRILARAGAIFEDETLGTRRERWWRRPDKTVMGVASADQEGRELDRRMLAVFFARDEEVRHRFILGRPSDAWQEASFVGNWFVSLTPAEADELGRKLFALVDEVRRRGAPAGGTRALVSLSVLPVLGERR
jgi:DNA-binding transcriptional ArsR family regulator